MPFGSAERRIAALLVLLCWSGSVPAQTESFLSPDPARLRVARQVFDDLLLAIGDGRAPPSLRLQPLAAPGPLQVAWFSPRQHSVTLQEQAYEVCASMDADSLDALAALLGHELAHFYKDHGWVGDFGNGFADLEIGQAVTQLEQTPARIAALEAEADYFGGFFGYVAGYDAYGATPALQERIYTAYGMTDDKPGYPTLAARQEIARRSQAQLEELIPVFEAGQRLLLMRRYEEAARCFDFIARTFPSREILNNAGVARALEAVDLFDVEELNAVYPLELDGESRLRSGLKGEESLPEASQIKRRTLLLEQARTWLEKAMSRDPLYSAAHINLACVADLLGEPEEALWRAQKALKVARDNDGPLPLAHAHTIRGIARLHADPPDSAGAQSDFEAALPSANLLARLNLASLQGTLSAASDVTARDPASTPERIAGQSAQDFERSVVADARARIPGSGPGEPVFLFYAQQGTAWAGIVIDLGYGTASFVWTEAGYSGATASGARIGDDVEGIRSAYGEPAFLVSGRNGVHHAYPDDGLVVQTDAEGRVRGWMIHHFFD